MGGKMYVLLFSYLSKMISDLKVFEGSRETF